MIESFVVLEYDARIVLVSKIHGFIDFSTMFVETLRHRVVNLNISWIDIKCQSLDLKIITYSNSHQYSHCQDCLKFGYCFIVPLYLYII